MSEPVKVIGNLIKSELGLADGQVMLAYQKYEIPETEGLFVSVRELEAKTISVNSNPDGGVSGMNEIQSATVLHIIQVDFMSFNNEARTRKEEFVMALHSVAAQRAMEDNLMQFGRNPGLMVDASSLEETKFLNRFTVTITVTSLHQKTKAVDYFDSFSGEFEENDATEPTPFTPTEA